jgi:hypothetical protein
MGIILPVLKPNLASCRGQWTSQTEATPKKHRIPPECRDLLAPYALKSELLMRLSPINSFVLPDNKIPA